MIRYRPSENLFDSDAVALVNPVNCVGIMGKGLAKEFKECFPANAAMYKIACEAHRLQPGIPYITRDYTDDRLTYIIHAPTKDHWRGPSQLGWIDDIAAGLRWFCLEHEIQSIAIPKLGCGEGGLFWPSVHGILTLWLGDLDGVDVQIYGEPIPG